MTASQRLLLIAVCVCLSACGSLSSPPRDRFYRLQPMAPSSLAEQAHPVALHIPAFEASGLHSERSLVYVHADETTLDQYGYHFWIDSPRLLLQSALADFLRDRLDMRIVMQPAANARVLRGRIIRFERQARPSAPHVATVALHFEAFDGASRLPVLSRGYSEVEELADDSVESYAAATNRAVRKAFERLATDLLHLWQP
jgi:ABC-type uncharacterized transport system auxiliary subunit